MWEIEGTDIGAAIQPTREVYSSAPQYDLTLMNFVSAIEQTGVLSGQVSVSEWTAVLGLAQSVVRSPFFLVKPGDYHRGPSSRTRLLAMFVERLAHDSIRALAQAGPRYQPFPAGQVELRRAITLAQQL